MNPTLLSPVQSRGSAQGACCSGFFHTAHQLLLARRRISNLTKQDASHPAHRSGGRAVSEGGAAQAGQSPAESARHDRRPDHAAQVTAASWAGGGGGGGAGVRTDSLTPDFLLVLISQPGSQPYLDIVCSSPGGGRCQEYNNKQDPCPYKTSFPTWETDTTTTHEPLPSLPSSGSPEFSFFFLSRTWKLQRCYPLDLGPDLRAGHKQNINSWENFNH